MFENKKTEVQGIHYSRYIASWRNCGGASRYGEQFEKWLEENGCTAKEIRDICEMAICGKMELEMTAGKYVERMYELITKIENDEETEELP